ncbi:hypothetical protein HMI56_005055, partial [Coelomomyces lativittatus]
LEESISKLVRSHSDNLKDLKMAIYAVMLIEAQMEVATSRHFPAIEESKALAVSHFKRKSRKNPFSKYSGPQNNKSFTYKKKGNIILHLKVGTSSTIGVRKKDTWLEYVKAN